MEPDTEKGSGFFMSSDPSRVLSKIEAVPEGCLLTAILPLRVRNGHEDARLDFALLDKQRPREVDFLVVDDGSAPDLAERVGERCRELGFGYVRLETRLQSHIPETKLPTPLPHPLRQIRRRPVIHHEEVDFPWALLVQQGEI